MFAVIRIRGTIGNKRKVEDALKMLRLNAVNNCVIVPDNAVYKGMLNFVKDSVTYGEINKETLVAMLKKRLRLKGDKRIDENTFKAIIKFDSIDAFADELIKGKVKLNDFEQLQPLFRLTPPSKGFKSVREHYPKGDLGYRENEINELLMRMI